MKRKSLKKTLNLKKEVISNLKTTRIVGGKKVPTGGTSCDCPISGQSCDNPDGTWCMTTETALYRC